MRAVSAASAETIQYEIRFPNAANREGIVTIRFNQIPAGPLRVRMARSSPGRYATHEFAKNVYGVQATDAGGKAARRGCGPRRRNGASPGTLARWSSRTRSSPTAPTAPTPGIDPTRAHLNIPATFAWAPGLETRPIQVTFHPFAPEPGRSQRSCSRRTIPGPSARRTCSTSWIRPTHLGTIDMREWTVTSGGRTQTVRLAMDHLGTADEVTELHRPHEARGERDGGVSSASSPRSTSGPTPSSACYRPNCAGDGMEHRNSTSLTSSARRSARR